jgi:hypothetical protein
MSTCMRECDVHKHHKHLLNAWRNACVYMVSLGRGPLPKPRHILPNTNSENKCAHEEPICQVQQLHQVSMSNLEVLASN